MEIKILGICGTPVKGETNTEYLIQATLAAARQQAEGITTEVVRLADTKMGGCTHCNWCFKRQTAEKFCAKDDGMKQIYPKVVDADALILGTPVYIGRISWLLAAFLDRLRALVEGRYYGIKGPMGGALRGKVIGGVSVGWMRHGGVETALLNLLIAAAITDMIPVTGGFGFGVGGVSAGPLGRELAVKEDRYALVGARKVGTRVAQVAAWIKAGKKALSDIPACL